MIVLAYMAGQSTPFFLRTIEHFIAGMNGRVSAVHFVIGDRYQFLLATKQNRDPRIHLIYQHEQMDPFQKPAHVSSEELSHLEERYGLPNLRRYILSQRLIDRLTDEQKVAYLATYLRFFEELVGKVRPDLFITGGQDSLPFLAAHQVAHKNGCLCLILTPGWIPGWVFVVDNEYLLIPGVPELYESLKKRGLTAEEQGLAQTVRNSYLVKKIKPTAFAAGHSVPIIPSPLRFLRAAWQQARYESRYFDTTLSENIRRSILVRARYPIQKTILKLLSTTQVDNERSFYYPLHYEPEASIDILGTPYRDQAALVEQISAALPAQHILYVKEHPHMNPGSRPIGFYRRLHQLGNVRLVDQRVDGHRLLARCKGVLTIAGTSGFEALFYGKPVLLFGHTFYEDFTEGVIRPRGLEEFAQKLQTIAHFPGFDPALLDKFVVAVLKRSYPGINETTAPEIHDRANDKALADALIAELQFRQNKGKDSKPAYVSTS